MRISIIVPVYNNAKDLLECVAALQVSSLPRTEIIVVDDASTDETAVIAASLGVHVLTLRTNSGPAAARNYGARHAAGEILLFVDADVVLASGALDHIATDRHASL
jgi:glycosyltransferase involved in cell wall biosynthesis